MEKSGRVGIRVLDEEICIVTLSIEGLRMARPGTAVQVARRIAGGTLLRGAWEVIEKGRMACRS